MKRTTKELQIYKQNLYLSLLDDFSKGLNPKHIKKKRKLYDSKMQYYLSVMKKKGWIRKVGYGTWEITKKGELQRTTKSLRGGRKLQKVVELWRLGYRFRISHDNEIPELKTQKLRNKGYVSQGHILKCWITKGKNILDIYGTVAKGNNVWDATIKAMTELVACKNYIESNYHLQLDPVKPLRPDIILNTPETKKLAEEIHEEFGRVRTEFFEVDQSKTGKPEFEARTPESAKNMLDRIAMNNSKDMIEKKMENLEKIMMGSVQTQNQMVNLLRMMVISLRMIAENSKSHRGNDDHIL